MLPKLDEITVPVLCPVPDCHAAIDCRLAAGESSSMSYVESPGMKWVMRRGMIEVAHTAEQIIQFDINHTS